MTCTITLYGVVCDVEYTVISSGRLPVMYLRNGDPGYPAEPAEFDILSITCGGEDISPFIEKMKAWTDVDALLYEAWYDGGER